MAIETERLKPAPGGEASYAVLAHILSAYFELEDVIEPRQVHMWARRKTKNKAGRAFPLPVRIIENARPPQPSRLFSIREVLDWYAEGVPGRHANQHDGRFGE